MGCIARISRVSPFLLLLSLFKKGNRYKNQEKCPKTGEMKSLDYGLCDSLIQTFEGR
jgi:hypothetical protein